MHPGRVPPFQHKAHNKRMHALNGNTSAVMYIQLTFPGRPTTVIDLPDSVVNTLQADGLLTRTDSSPPLPVPLG